MLRVTGGGHEDALALRILAACLAAALLSLNGEKALASAILTVPGIFRRSRRHSIPRRPAIRSMSHQGRIQRTLTFTGKAVSLESTGGASQTTIVAPGGTTVTIGPAGSIAGFTISGGTATFGAGMAVSGSGTLIAHDIFQSNQQGSGGFGAAIGGNIASPVIKQDLFTGNSCDSQFLSGVIAFVNSSSPAIENNVFHDNPCRAINLTLPEGNTPIVINNTMVRNSVGVRVDGRVPSAGEIVRNNIVVDNGVGLEVDFGSGPTWDHNLVFGNTQNYQGIADQTGTNGNLSADPLFVNSGANNFRLLPGSPAIGAGSAVDAPSVDFNGTPRPPPASISARSSPGASTTTSRYPVTSRSPSMRQALPEQWLRTSFLSPRTPMTQRHPRSAVHPRPARVSRSARQRSHVLLPTRATRTARNRLSSRSRRAARRTSSPIWPRPSEESDRARAWPTRWPRLGRSWRPVTSPTPAVRWVISSARCKPSPGRPSGLPRPGS